MRYAQSCRPNDDFVRSGKPSGLSMSDNAELGMFM
jgi:hypothetical protein